MPPERAASQRRHESERGDHEAVRHNEERMRELNDRRVSGCPADCGPILSLLCECGRPTCTDYTVLTVREDRAVRASPDHFAVSPGHEHPEFERVVARHLRFDVVEKPST